MVTERVVRDFPQAGERRALRPLLGAAAIALCVSVSACSGQVDRHGHLFNDAELQQVQPGLSRDQVMLALGSPTTSSNVGLTKVDYYIGSTHKSVAFLKPTVVDRRVVAVYYDGNASVTKVARYGLKDGRVFDFISRKTPTQSREVSLLRQFFGRLNNSQAGKESKDDPFDPND